MKKHNISQFLKSRSFYVVLFVAVIAIAAVTIIGVNIRSDKTKHQNLADLNTPIDIAENEETNIGEDFNEAANTDAAANDNEVTKDEFAHGKLTNDELLEYDLGPESYEENIANENKESTELAAGNENASGNTEVANQANTQDNDAANETEDTVSVMQPSATKDGLKFSNESVITWPVKGNVIMPFSVEKLVHYSTLGEWKTNPAIIISSEVGTEVLAAAKGIVNKVEYDEETGTTVTMNIGNGYEIVYGQLDQVTCESGDLIKEGTCIGKVAQPTKYYSVEGSNLYLQILNEKTPVNPMLFLAGEE